jgi:hypothetical protein
MAAVASASRRTRRVVCPADDHTSGLLLSALFKGVLGTITPDRPRNEHSRRTYSSFALAWVTLRA